MKNIARQELKVAGQSYGYYALPSLEKQGIASISRLPFSIRILLENLLRKCDGRIVTEADVEALANWKPQYEAPYEIAYHPSRVVMQDFTGVPGIVDLASMRQAMVAQGGDPSAVNPLVPVDLVTDHSVQVDYFACDDAVEKNLVKEYERNGERYSLLKWAQNAFHNMRIFPPGAGIVHQVNLEYIARVVMSSQIDGELVAYPDSLVGTDSHTTMINGLGVMGWGVGGIEAEAVMLGQPYFMKIPAVVGVKLTGSLREGITATDLVLTVTELLRQHNVVEKFVEFFGSGVKELSLPDRATLSNMSPEYGATMGYFPIDEVTIDYLRFTGRHESASLVEAYTKAQGLFFSGSEEPEYSQVIEFDMSTVKPCLAGPARPQDRIPLGAMERTFSEDLKRTTQHVVNHKQETAFTGESGCDHEPASPLSRDEKFSTNITLEGSEVTLQCGSVVIAAITSCTNTSNPSVLIGAGLLAEKAVKAGLRVPPYVKTSLAPGSKVVVEYLKKAGLLPWLEALGFHVVGFGCTTCIGNSGPLIPEVAAAVQEKELVVAAVLSGNRNFEARIHPLVRANFLASPMLVVAFALAGRVDIDLESEPLGNDAQGNPIFLKHLWPQQSEIKAMLEQHLDSSMFKEQYATVLEGDRNWNELNPGSAELFAWAPESTYIRNPPYFEDFTIEPAPLQDIVNARVLAIGADSVTTDHISPAGAIPKNSPAASYLREHDVAVQDFNSYGSRRGNHEVMIRGTFGNVRFKNKLAHGKEGGFTTVFPENEIVPIYTAATRYRNRGVPLIVLAGKEYGTGSSRDWAAKGTLLLGVRAVIAQSFERIHRNNLVGMGVLPLQFHQGQSVDNLGLDGSEQFTIRGIKEMTPGAELSVTAITASGEVKKFSVILRLDTDIDLLYYTHGGILPYVLRQLL